MQTARRLMEPEYLRGPAPAAPAAAPRPVRNSQAGSRAVTAQIAVCAAVIFFAMVLLLVRHADLAAQKVHVYQMKTEIKKLELTRDELKATLDQGLDLEAIEKTAVEKLGMQYPAQTQIVYTGQTALYTLKEPVRDTAPSTGETVERWVASLPWVGEKQAMLVNRQ